jgi:hypothetical protein
MVLKDFAEVSAVLFAIRMWLLQQKKPWFWVIIKSLKRKEVLICQYLVLIKIISIPSKTVRNLCCLISMPIGVAPAR